MANTLRLNGFWNSHPAYERVVHKTGRDSAIYFSKTYRKAVKGYEYDKREYIMIPQYPK